MKDWVTEFGKMADWVNTQQKNRQGELGRIDGVTFVGDPGRDTVHIMKLTAMKIEELKKLGIPMRFVKKAARKYVNELLDKPPMPGHPCAVGEHGPECVTPGSWQPGPPDSSELIKAPEILVTDWNISISHDSYSPAPFSGPGIIGSIS